MAKHAVAVTVYRREIASQFQRTGQAYRWLDSVRRAMHRACEMGAPSRTQELRRSHRSSIRGLNQYAATAKVENTAKHANWVHDGTRSPIVATGQQGMLWVPARRGSAARVLRTNVSGQASNPWIDNACSRVAMSRGATRRG